MPSSNNPRRLFLVDDHPSVLIGTAAFLRSQPGFEICGTATTVNEALQQVPQLRAELVVVDLFLGAGCGFDLLTRLRTAHPHLPLIAYSGHPAPAVRRRALAAGANQFVYKCSVEDLATAARALLQMEEPVPAIAGGPAPFPLSKREQKIYELLGEGRALKEIAAELNLSRSTINTYCKRIRAKLGHPGNQALQVAAVREHALKQIRPSAR